MCVSTSLHYISFLNPNVGCFESVPQLGSNILLFTVLGDCLRYRRTPFSQRVEPHPYRQVICAPSMWGCVCHELGPFRRFRRNIYTVVYGELVVEPRLQPCSSRRVLSTHNGSPCLSVKIRAQRYSSTESKICSEAVTMSSTLTHSPLTRYFVYLGRLLSRHEKMSLVVS